MTLLRVLGLVLLGIIPASGDWVTQADDIKFCWDVKVLRDRVDGWPAACLDLENEEDSITTVQACAAACQRNIQCAVWQWSNTTGCFWGKNGRSCEQRAGDVAFRADAGQRLQHGTIKVVRSTLDLEAKGLAHLGIFESQNSTYNLDRCRDTCYSDVKCRVWQYGRDGCWVERPDNNYNWDGTLTGSSEWAKTMVAGQEIVHHCPDRVEDKVVTVHQSPKQDWACWKALPWDEKCKLLSEWSSTQIAIVLGPTILFFLACCFCCCRSKRRKTGHSRREMSMSSDEYEAFSHEDTKDDDEEMSGDSDGEAGSDYSDGETGRLSPSPSSQKRLSLVPSLPEDERLMYG